MQLKSALFETLCDGKLIWLPQLGIGYYPVEEQPYDGTYWDKYRGYDRTPMGDRLTAARIALVRKYIKESQRIIIDVGIGGGRFVEEMDCYGWDINPSAVAWLDKHHALMDPRQVPVAAMTFWDSLEHIHEPSGLLENAKEWVFVSCPIFENPGHILRSKHFRPDEHCFYFTRKGLADFMEMHGFGLVEINSMEEEAGREDIGTFVFKRMA